MEYRETPRTPATDGRLDGVIEGAASRPRSRRFEFVRSERHLDLTRVGLVGGALHVSLSILGYLSSKGILGAIRWLHRQPQYQVRFQDIELENPPPPWLRGGAEGLLRQVREASRESEVLQVLDLGENQLARDFLESPWIEEVKRVVKPPHAIKVRLVYRNPVAILTYARGEETILDRAGAILPQEDIEMSKLGPLPLIRILAGGLVPSTENRPGKTWRSAVAGPAGMKVERAVVDAARLAGFLLEPGRASEAAAVPALRILSIIATNEGKPDERGLFVQNAEDAIILWGNAPDTENSGEITSEEKWDILRKWVKSSASRALPARDYWAFRRSELKAVPTRRSNDR
jgi:hypothetical protein